MKKLLLTLIAALAICSSSFAQTTYWDEFDYHDYMMNTGIVAFIQVDGNYITDTDNWDQIEIAAFVGTDCRGHMFLNNYVADGDPYPIMELQLYYTDPGETVTWKMYDHSTGTEYTDCTANMTVLTGEWHDELYYDYDDALVLNFAAPSAVSFTKHIIGYGDVSAEGGYYLIASPIGAVDPTDDTKVTGMINPSGNFDLFDFNPGETGAEWRNYRVDAFELQPGKGYLYASPTDTDIIFTGTEYTGTNVFPLTYVDGNVPGVNFLGNPFGHEVWLQDGREFYVLNSAGSNVIVSPNASIGPMEGFFVQTTAEATESVTLVDADPNAKTARFAVNVSNEQSVIDRAVVRIGEGRNLAKFSINDESAQVYIPQFGKDYAVVTADEMGEMPVNFKAAKNGTYTIDINTENVEFGYLHLFDNKTGNDVDLLETPSYTFDASRTDYTSRFRLIFATGTNNGECFGFISDGNILLNGVNANTTVQVIDALGRILVSDKGVNTVSTDNMTPGVYVLRLVNGSDVKTQKIVVR